MPIQSNNIFKENDELDDLWGTNTGLSISNVEYEENKNQIKIITNYFPDYPLFENSISRGGPYASNPRAMPLDEVNIFLYPSSFDYTSHQPNNIYIYNPQLFDIGIIGRPNELLEEAQHWTEGTSPQEAISLDPLSIEAWDARLAGNSYEGILRFNVVAIDKFKNDIEYNQFKNYNGRPLRLFNDIYGGHTQPHGEYHLHSFKDTKDLKHKNKVIGYSFDSNNFGFPIMGLGTEIYEPIFDANNYLINFETQKLPSISGYTLSNSFIDNRKSQVPLVGSINNIPETAPGIFHVDYEYIGSDGTQKSNESYYLDIFNMGFVDIGNDIVKAYVQTEEYPYTVHTPLSFDLKESETDLQSTHNFFEYNNRNQLPSEIEELLEATYWKNLDQMIKRMDIISVNCPLNSETRNLMSAERLNLMTPNSYLINSSRSEIIDEEELAKLLKENRIAGAGLDVFTRERKRNLELLNAPNTILIPHLGSATVEGRIEMGEKVIVNIKTYIDGHNPPNRII